MKKVNFSNTIDSYIPDDIILVFPKNSLLPKEDQHFLISVPWNDKYLDFVPEDFRSFFQEVLPNLSKRATDVHTAICMSYLDEFISKAKGMGKKVNRNILAYALILHDSGWSELTQAEIATSLGVKGLALTKEAMGPKEKHAVLGEKFAREILTEKQTELGLINQEIETICLAIRFHDKPSEVAGLGKDVPIEVQLLVDLDHIWSFIRLGFWMDTLRKAIAPKEYLKNLENDLDGYFATDIGRQKAQELLSECALEVAEIDKL